MRADRLIKQGVMAAAIIAAMGVNIDALKAAVITIGNSSFETPVQVAGNPSDFTQAGTVAQSSEKTNKSSTSADAIPYWTVNMTNAGASQVFGVANEISTKYAGTSGGANSLPANDESYNYLSTYVDPATSTAPFGTLGYQFADGYQMGYANLANPTGTANSAVFTYDPNDTATAGATAIPLGNFTPGDTYTLSIAIGDRLDKVAYNYGLTLLEDGVPVGTATTGVTGNKVGTYILATYTFTAGATDIGAIGIQFSGSTTGTTGSLGTQLNFDNVQLTDTAGTAPEPASLGVLGAGAVALLTRRRKA